MPEQHALLGASSAHRWLECPPSARIGAEFPSRESEAAEEGTKAHAIAEAILRGESTPDESNQYILDYVEYCRQLNRIYVGSSMKIEQQLSYSQVAKKGFGTADCIIYTKDYLHIVDFKYGVGLKVEAQDNPQMKLYALGAIFTLKIKPSVIRWTIFQPRIDNIQSSQIEFGELMDWANEVRPKAKEAWNGTGPLKAGDHCTFCPAKNICPEFKKLFTEKYLITF